MFGTPQSTREPKALRRAAISRQISGVTQRQSWLPSPRRASTKSTEHLLSAMRNSAMLSFWRSLSVPAYFRDRSQQA